jgi:hypothetical protein
VEQTPSHPHSKRSRNHGPFGSNERMGDGRSVAVGGRNVNTLVWRTAQIDYDDSISGVIGQVATRD